ncbi:hypothetical protein O181_073443 [Austropuccinia psidii MF-1]|uniref:Uncharacterized protein n=1 Tax=Austropuccinia psidii MF-1 TaxID=1389203 RepID=A0A9Q3F947_9BASI|nr:hypothetical protein [Austropuccinia psidii MF-1]
MQSIQTAWNNLDDSVGIYHNDLVLNNYNATSTCGLASSQRLKQPSQSRILSKNLISTLIHQAREAATDIGKQPPGNMGRPGAANKLIEPAQDHQ